MKEAAQTFIAETEDQQSAKFAKLNAVMDMQRMSEVQQQADHAKREMQTPLENQKLAVETAAKDEVARVTQHSQAYCF